MASYHFTVFIFTLCFRLFHAFSLKSHAKARSAKSVDSRTCLLANLIP